MTIHNFLDVEKIMQLIPHRYPMLMVDRILEVNSDGLIALKNVSMNEDLFNGHFPSHPVFPGVLTVEAMAQAAAIFVMNSEDIDPKTKVVYFMSIEEATFRKPIIPGDAIHLHIKKIKNRGAVWKMQGEAKVDGVRVADAKFTAMIVDK